MFRLPILGVPPVPETPETKALALLLRHLDVDQQRQLLSRGYFDVRFPDGLVVRLHNVQHGLSELRTGPLQGELLCVIPRAFSLPAADETLTKLLVLRAFRDWYLQTGVRQGNINSRDARRMHAPILAPGYKG